MSHLFWLDQERLNRIKHMFPKPRGVARADDRKVLSGIIHVIRNGLRWRDAPSDYGPNKTLYNRWARWSQMWAGGRSTWGMSAQVLMEAQSNGMLHLGHFTSGMLDKENLLCSPLNERTCSFLAF